MSKTKKPKQHSITVETWDGQIAPRHTEEYPDPRLWFAVKSEAGEVIARIPRKAVTFVVDTALQNGITAQREHHSISNPNQNT